MKNSKDKIWMGWVALCFIVLHFCFIFIYAMPTQLVNEKLQSYTKPYVEPIFTQKWSMFAPTPIIDAKIEVKFYFEKDSTEWISPTEKANNVHKWLRMTHYGELVLAESNVAFWVNIDLENLGLGIEDRFPIDKIEEFRKGYSYFIIKNYLSGNARYLYDKEVKIAIFRCYRKNVVTNKSGWIELPPFTY